jgi:hypothetical protein
MAIFSQQVARRSAHSMAPIASLKFCLVARKELNQVECLLNGKHYEWK